MLRAEARGGQRDHDSTQDPPNGSEAENGAVYTTRLVGAESAVDEGPVLLDKENDVGLTQNVEGGYRPDDAVGDEGVAEEHPPAREQGRYDEGATGAQTRQQLAVGVHHPEGAHRRQRHHPRESLRTEGADEERVGYAAGELVAPQQEKSRPAECERRRDGT